MSDIKNNLIIDEYGTKCWYLNGEYHREDGSAIEYTNGTKMWYLNGKYHREDGPTVEWVDGDKSWYLNGTRHREDGPAIELSNGNKKWYYHSEEINCNSIEEFSRFINLKVFW